MEINNSGLKGLWNASAFFCALTRRNRLARRCGFTFCRVSSLQGFEEALHTMQESRALMCVSDTADGYIAVNNTPRTRRVKTVFMAMRHGLDDMEARGRCFELMRELFRQFMSVLTRERVRLAENMIYIDERITFSEIDRYFFSGGACAYFQIAVDVCTDLRYNPDEWIQ